MKKNYNRFLAIALCLIMVLSIMPISAFAIQYDTAATDDYYTIISKKDYILCDGATESDIVLNNEKGTRRQVLHVIEVDPNNTNVEVLPSYYAIDKDLNDPSNWSAQIMEKQMDYYRDELGYNVVGGMNTSLAYDNEAPYSLMVYNGQVLADGSIHPGAKTYLAVIKNDDGTVRFELRSIADGLQGDEWQAVSANFGFVITNGELVTKAEERTTAAADRSMIGIKADGTLVICQAEGRNAPYAVGLSNYEIGEAMLALGCVWAVNGDGGGSSQFLTKREGESDYSLRNIPSDGSPRATINGIIVASKTAVSGVFDHVSMIAKDQYITPGSSVEIEIKGVDASGAAAALPESGLVYEVSSGYYSNGVYTADSATGIKTITAYYEGKVVGSVSVEVVIPTAIEFTSSEMVVPYGKSDVDLGLVAYYGNFEVPLKASDVIIALSNNSIGAINGFAITTVPEGTELEDVSGVITATLVYNNISAVANISLGKGSEILYDFEDQDVHGFYRGTSANYNYNNPAGEVAIVDNTSGRVHNGNYAMQVEVDFSNSLEAGFQLGALITGEEIVLENAKRLGMWIYIPDEAVGLRIDSGISNHSGFWSIDNTGEATVTEPGFVYGMEESGWRYISIDISTSPALTIKSATQLLKFYISQKDGKNDYYYGDQSSVNGKYVFYIDDITVDYSSAVEDRESPIFSGMSYAVPGMDESVSIAKDTSAGYKSIIVNSNILSFIASVAENTSKTNYTGIDVNSGKVYIDGVDYSDKLIWTGNSKMSLNEVVLSNGRHEIKFVVCDRQGNYSSIIREIIVKSADEAPIKVVAHDPNADRILLGSLYYVDVVSADISKVNSVSVTLDLNNISVWELDHMDVADGFEAKYVLLPGENVAQITITRIASTAQSGEQILVSIPVRTWQLAPTVAIYGHAGKVWMYPDYKKGHEILPMDISIEVDAGLVTYVDGTTDSFASAKIQVDTEMSGNAYTSSGSAANNYIRNESWYASWNAGHDHRTETAQYYAAGATNVVAPVALADKAVTCTESGYIGRTYCEVCNSIVDWGETVEATGHSYEMIDGELACHCGELFNGVYTDGKTYVDGAVVADGWFENRYYVDGVYITGIVDIDGVYYAFDDNGLSNGVYTGLVISAEGTRYAIAGKTVTGWQYIDGDYYYFKKSTGIGQEGRRTFVYDDNVTYTFDSNGRLISGEWVRSGAGLRYYYGPWYYSASNTSTVAWAQIKGQTYGFDQNGYRYEGINSVKESKWSGYVLHEFDANGVYVGEYKTTESGLVYGNNGKYFYVVDGKPTQNGLTKIGNDYYYFNTLGEAVVGSKYVSAQWTNGYFEAGTYDFGTDGKMILKSGIVDGYYYIDGVLAAGAGVVKYNGGYYYINSSGAVVTGKKYVTAEKANGLLSVGIHDFGEDGNIALKNGVIDGYYYIDDAIALGAGVIEYNGGYYYINSSGAVVTGKKYVTAEKANGLLSVGIHDFGVDGKMILKNGVVDGYYYLNNEIVKGAGVVEFDGGYYYINSSGAVVTGNKYVTADKANGLLNVGIHDFGTDGKIVVKNGVIDGYYYINNEIVKGAGVVEFDGGYYYINSSGAVVIGNKYVTAEKANGILNEGFYNFGNDGKLAK